MAWCATAFRTVRALAVHGEIDQRRELARQVGDVHAGAAVHLGRVLAGQHRDPERAARRLARRARSGNRSPVEAHPSRHDLLALAHHGDPACEYRELRVLSWSLSTPTCSPSAP